MKCIISSPPNLSKSWTHGERDSMKRTSRLRQNVDIILDDPTPQELCQSLKEGFCWWCKRGGFKTVANHTSHAHGIMASDIRNLAKLVKGESIATPEYSMSCKTRPQTLHCEKLLASDKHCDKPRSYTEEGLRRKRDRCKILAETYNKPGRVCKQSSESKEAAKMRCEKLIFRLKNDPVYYKKWREACSSTGRDKRIVATCPICHILFKKYETSNRKTCGNPECIHILKSNITTALNKIRWSNAG